MMTPLNNDINKSKKRILISNREITRKLIRDRQCSSSLVRNCAFKDVFIQNVVAKGTIVEQTSFNSVSILSSCISNLVCRPKTSLHLSYIGQVSFNSSHAIQDLIVDRVIVVNTVFSNGLYQGTSFKNVSFINTLFINCVFMQTTFEDCSFSGCIFYIEPSILKEVGDFSTPKFTNCNFGPNSVLGYFEANKQNYPSLAELPIETNYIILNKEYTFANQNLGTDNICSSILSLENRDPNRNRHLRKALVEIKTKCPGKEAIRLALEDYWKYDISTETVKTTIEKKYNYGYKFASEGLA